MIQQIILFYHVYIMYTTLIIHYLCFSRRKNIFELLAMLPKLDENSNFMVVVRFELIGLILDAVRV